MIIVVVAVEWHAVAKPTGQWTRQRRILLLLPNTSFVRVFYDNNDVWLVLIYGNFSTTTSSRQQDLNYIRTYLLILQIRTYYVDTNNSWTAHVVMSADPSSNCYLLLLHPSSFIHSNHFCVIFYYY